MDDRTRSKFSFREIMGNMTEEQEISHAKWIQENQPYFAIALPTTSVKDSVGKYGATTYMSFTIFKKISYTPAKFKRTLLGDWKRVAWQSLIVETMDGRKMEAFEPWLSPYKNYKGVQEEFLVLSDAVFQELQKNFVHPRLTMNNYTQFSRRFGEPGAWELEYFSMISACYHKSNRDCIAEAYGAWKETIPEQRRFFDDYFVRQDALDCERQQKEERLKREAEAAKRRHIDAFEQDFGRPQQQYNYFKCKKCGTNCRVPANGKNLVVTCRCGNEFPVFSAKRI